MRAVIVAKTEMGRNICVGAVCEATGDFLRLIPATGASYHSWNTFDAQISDVVTLEGHPEPLPDSPHVEDFLVSRWNIAGAPIEDLSAWIREHCKIWSGDPSCLFDGHLAATAFGSQFLERTSEMPSHSVGFWRTPWPLYHRCFSNDDGTTKHSYAAAKCFGFRVPYKGFLDPIEQIPANALVRVSLARWVSFRDDVVEKCWLQLSGWYLPGQIYREESDDKRGFPVDDDIPF